MTTTDTPRMDANQYADYILNHYDRNSRMDTLCLARSLVENGYGRAEKAEAEVEFWKAKAYEAEHSQGKHEAEVERLKAKLCRAIEIADVLRSGGSRACRELHHSKRDQHEYGEVCPVEERLEKAEDELDQLKATINQEIHDHWKVFLEKQLSHSLANQLKTQAEVKRLRDELAKGAKVLSTIVSALEDAVPWIRETLNRD